MCSVLYLLIKLYNKIECCAVIARCAASLCYRRDRCIFKKINYLNSFSVSCVRDVKRRKIKV